MESEEKCVARGSASACIQRFQDLPSQRLLDLRVAWHRFDYPGLRVDPERMRAALALEVAVRWSVRSCSWGGEQNRAPFTATRTSHACSFLLDGLCIFFGLLKDTVFHMYATLFEQVVETYGIHRLCDYDQI